MNQHWIYFAEKFKLYSNAVKAAIRNVNIDFQIILFEEKK